VPTTSMSTSSSWSAPHDRAGTHAQALLAHRYGVMVMAMAHTFGCRVDAPVDEVFAWHARPGAIQRLTPPWLPVRVAAEAASLRDGRAVLALPGGLRWVAQHDPAAYDPPRRFADELASLPLRAALPWRHIHEFAAVAPSSTRVTDHITSPLPAGLLRPMMGYRHRQLAGDLAAHRWARQLRSGPLTVAITGSSGLVGSALTALLTSGGHRVIRLVRRAPADDGERRWDPEDPDPGLLRDTSALAVHLAGLPAPAGAAALLVNGGVAALIHQHGCPERDNHGRGGGSCRMRPVLTVWDRTMLSALIAQRSRVQIPPPLPGSAGQGPDRQEAVGPF